MSIQVSEVRKVLKKLISSTKKLTTARSEDVFSELSFNSDFERITYGQNRQMGTYDITYLVSPNPDNALSTAPSLTYDQITQHIKENIDVMFLEAELVLLTYAFGNTEIVTDSETGSVSLIFTINIKVT